MVWKKYQKKSQDTNKLKLAFIALGLILALIVLGKVISVLTSLNNPITKNLNKSSHSLSLDKKSSVNIVFSSQQDSPKATILSYHPEDQKITILNLSEDIYMDLPRSYGEWRLGSIYKLGQEEKPQIGGELLKISLSKLLGLPVDRVVITKTPIDLESEITSWRKNPFSLVSFVSGMDSDLTPLESLKLFWDLKGVRADKLESLDLAESLITDSKLLPDSTRVLGINNIKLDLFVREKMSDSKITEEGKSIGIYNATSHPGLAQIAARMVTNLGGTVVTVSNTEDYKEKSSIFVQPDDDSSSSITYQTLADTFASDCLEKVCESDDPQILNSRAQINIVLGEDFFNFWFKR